MRSMSLATLVALLALTASRAKPPAPSAISVLQGVQISADDPNTRHVESVVAVNPRNPLNLISASMVFGEASGVAVYSSRDGGHSWKRAANGALSRPLFGGGQDPALAFDPDGNAYLATIGNELALWKSSDGGQSWGEPAVVPGASYDRDWIGCDTSGSEGLRGQVYVVAKHPITVFDHPGADLIAVSTSRDGGGSFPFPRLFLPAPEKVLVNTVSDFVVTPDGKLVLALEGFEPENLHSRRLLTGSYPTLVSSDGGRSFSPPRPGPAFRVYGHAWEGKSLLAVGGGKLAQDVSAGARKGWLYLTWLDAIEGYYRVMAAASSNGGETWSRPVRVSDSQTATDESTPAIAVNGEGVVGVSWYDRRGDPTDRCYQPFFAASADGGATFSPNRKVAEDFTCPTGRPPAAGGEPGPGTDPAVDAVNSEYRFKNGGDTQGLVGLVHGAFHLAWINGSAGELQLWSTALVVDRDLLAPAHR
jgi:hypothetical protein